ncbi:hypothetical protein BIY24_00925 [Halobacteriovorax marinus]|uniref:Periplasmic protein n=1 Tax=Halobacteriovorax marinus (strain ATCC BAA-682 / DSM 15412 / SJ) TaxID=862908 RepID=E1X2S5_HALMS|nr:hypothetical protein [Halobacteriovorax marinus]ATH06554.1 hypothetical protein BIY24_00925 [Halobacteriovorax marinus]CBW25120.1 putative periplasmic protein [Halobacteriovorax marinus SJ]
MKKLVLITAIIAGFSSTSFAGTVGESDTSCIKNQSTQARASKEVKETEVQVEQEKTSKDKQS